MKRSEVKLNEQPRCSVRLSNVPNSIFFPTIHRYTPAAGHASPSPSPSSCSFSQSPMSWGVYLGNSGAITRIFRRSLLRAYRPSCFSFASRDAWSFRNSSVWQEFSCSCSWRDDRPAEHVEESSSERGGGTEGGSPSSSLLPQASPESVCSIRRLYAPPSFSPFRVLI